MKHPHAAKNSVARQFIFLIILFSSIVTLVITAIQLYLDYNSDIELIHSELSQIEGVHLKSLNAALWASDTKLLQTSIEGILKIRDMQFVSISDNEKTWVSTGKIKDGDNIQRIYTMTYQHRNKSINIGALNVNVSLNGVYQRLMDKVLVVLISNAIKTALVALFIYFLFHRIVARHLTTISDFAGSKDTLTNNKTLTLKRRSRKNDEFDIMVNSINEMYERLHAQITEINHQKENLFQTLNSIGDAVITTDKEGNVTRLNPVAEKLTGWSNNEACQQSLNTIFTIMNTETREPVTNPVEEVLETGQTVYSSNHTTLTSKNGNEYQITNSAAPIKTNGEFQGMVLVFNDVTEQYQMRARLAVREQEQRDILQSMVDAVITIDETGVISSFNRSAERLFGYEASEITGEKINQLMPENYSSHHDDYIKNFIKTGIPHIIGIGREVTGLRKNRETFPLRLSVAELPSSADGKKRFIGSCQDLSRFKEQEEQIRRSQKMDALGKLTGGIAHDYNNMLGVVIGYSEILEEKLKEQPKQRNYVHEILLAANRSANLTKKLLSFSRKKSSKTEKLNINTVLLNGQNMLEKTLTARIKLSFNLHEDLWPVCLDESDLEDTVFNLGINAMHAILKNGEINITTNNVSIGADNNSEIDLIPGDYVQLTIADSGTGIEEATIEKIFDPFYTTKGDQGTGLGLSQVYVFIKRCNGSIKVKSRPNAGTKFQLFFPRYVDSENDNKPAVRDTENSIAFSGKETILLVDDELALLTLGSDILTQYGYTVICANRAEKALKILESEKVDILISDIIMPEMDGYTLAEIVKEKYPQIPIQLVSGFAGEQSSEPSNMDLSSNLLQKPYTATDLLTKIRKALSETTSAE